MKALQNLSLKFKLALLFLLFTVFTLAVAGAVLFFYDLRLFRQELVTNLTALGDVIADNSTAALSFSSRENAQTTLESLHNEPKIVAARLYQREEKQTLFKELATYVRPGATPTFPGQPRADGHVFENDRLVLFRSIKQDDSDKVIGSLYIEADLGAIRHRLQVYTGELAVILFLSAILGGGLVIYLNRSISTPLRRVANSAGEIASGSLAVKFVDADRGDEVGLLTGAFQRMTETLRHQTLDLVEGVNVLASSSTEISTASSQLAASAAETAAVVNQTVSTVGEVKQTAELAHRRAQAVAESARSVAEISEAGQRTTNDMLAAMERIRGQMESIAESIVHLSAQSQSIAEITSTVNDLAEQSNLLAVNAAIEAARAGEQGKAFAVVAHEVKNLADQSKQATTKVRGVLSEVQKSISTVAMVTELGSKEANAGVRQAAAVGESIKQLAERIDVATSMGQQIAASSQQEVVGMDQMTLAMDNIKKATNQNLNGSKQVEAIARSLHELGQRIKRITEYYKL